MAYEKQDWNKFVWKEGQDNFQEMLNHIEDGIANAGQGGTADSLWEKGSGANSIQTKGTGCDARGQYAVAEGLSTLAESDLSHAEGWVTRTIIDDTDIDTRGHASHAEGSHTIAKGACSHAEGNSTESMGMYSHAEGSGTISGGRSSHAEGDGTVTENVGEHAEGTYNKSHAIKYDDAGNTIHSIGIGTSMINRKNAVEVMDNGDVYILGIGGYDGTNIDTAKTVQQVIAELENK